MDLTMERFINAGQNDFEFIIKHMTKPIEAEEMVFNGRWDDRLTEIVTELNSEFTADLDKVINHLQGIFSKLKEKFE